LSFIANQDSPKALLLQGQYGYLSRDTIANYGDQWFIR
jgi:hypothetical protein